MGRSEEDNNGERKRKREVEIEEEGEKKRKVLSSTRVQFVREIENKSDHSLPESVFLAILLPFVHESQASPKKRRCGSCGGDIEKNTEELRTVLKERGRALKPVVASVSSSLPTYPSSSLPCSCFSMPPPLDYSNFKFCAFPIPDSPIPPTPLSPLSSPPPLLSSSSPSLSSSSPSPHSPTLSPSESPISPHSSPPAISSLSAPSSPTSPPLSSSQAPIALSETHPSSPSIILQDAPLSPELHPQKSFPVSKKQPQICADTFPQQNQDDSCVEVASPLVVVYPSSDHPFMVVIREADLSCLSDRCYLNDNIILFYLLFIKHEKIPEWRAEMRQSQPQIQGDELTFFFADFLEEKRATAPGALEALDRMTKAVTTQPGGGERDSSSLPHFLIFPIHCYKHWCLAIVSSSDDEIRIDYLDSLGKHGDAVIKLLENFFMNCGWAPRPLNSSSSLKKTPRRVVVYDQEVPQQTNGFDCGLYILHYAELFCHHFISGNKKWPFSKQWFTKREVEEKRGAIQYILTQKKYQRIPTTSNSPSSSTSSSSSSSPSISKSPPSPASSLPPLFPLSPLSTFSSQPLPGEGRRLGKGKEGRRLIRSSSLEAPIMIEGDCGRKGGKKRPLRSSSLGDPIMIDDESPPSSFPSSSSSSRLPSTNGAKIVIDNDEGPSSPLSSKPPIMIDDESPPSSLSPSSSSSPLKSLPAKKRGGYGDVIGENGGGRGEDVIVIGD